MQRISEWIRAVFVAVMLLTCATLCWYAASQYALHFQVEDLTLSLETSRKREVKQQYEYDQVVAQLPVVAAQVEEMEPRAAAAKEREQELRNQRKELRNQAKLLEQQMTDLNRQLEELQKQLAELQK